MQQSVNTLHLDQHICIT